MQNKSSEYFTRHITRIITICLAIVLAFGISSTTVSAAQLKKPTLRTKKITSTSFTLKISKVKKATGYRVYCFNANSGKYKRLISTKKQSVKISNLQANTKYYFYVRAYKKTKATATTKAKIKLGKKSKILVIKTKKVSNDASTSSPSDNTNTNSGSGDANTSSNKDNSNTSNSTTINSSNTNSNSNTGNTSNATDAAKYAAEVLNLVNKERTNQGLSGLKLSDSLTAAANARAKELVKQFSHTRPDGSSCFTILKEFNITYYMIAENIASGYKSSEAVMKGWMDSEGHRENILSKDAGQIGIGYYYDVETRRPYWVQLFKD